MPLSRKQEFENELVRLCRNYNVTLNHAITPDGDFDYDPEHRWWFEGQDEKGETFFLEIDDLWNSI